MSVRRRQNWLGQQRVDVPHLKSVESAISNDFDELINGLVIGEDQSYVVRGFTINIPGSIGSSANGLQLLVEDSAFLHGSSDESGTFYTIPTGTPAEVLSSTTNQRVEGAFTPSTDNYVGIEFVRSVDDATIDQVYFWNPTTNIEITKTVPLAIILDYKIVISTSSFASNILPISIVQTDASNNVISITDRRALLYRLGTAGDTSPDPFYSYPWADGRAENFYESTSSTSDPFYGGDKQITTMKEFFDAMMSEIKSIKGTTYWYSEGSAGSLYRLRQDMANTAFTGRGNISHGIAFFEGQVAGMTTDVTIKSVSVSTTLTADSVKDINTLIAEFNEANNSKYTVLLNGDGSQVPTADIVLTSTPGKVNWSSDIFMHFIGGRLNYKIRENEIGTDITLLDNEVAYVTLNRGVDIVPNLVFLNGGIIVTSIGAVPWTADLETDDFIKNKVEGDEKYYQILTVDSPSQVTLTEAFLEISSGPGGFDAQYAFGVYETNPSPATDRHIRIADRGSVPFDEDVLWLLFRQDDAGSVAKVYGRGQGFTSGAELEQGEEMNISDNTSLSVLNYMGSANESDNAPDYITLAIDAKTGTENYNSTNGDNLTIRNSKLTSMMADKAQDKTIIYAPLIDYMLNTVNGSNQEITFFHIDSMAPTLSMMMSSSNNNGIVGLDGTLVLAENEAAYFEVNRNAAFSLVDLSELIVVDIADVPLKENVYMFAVRGTGTSVYLWDGIELVEGKNLTVGTISEILDENAYDEQITVVVGAPADDNQITGPVAPNTIITLPVDSKDSDSVQGYVVGKGVLEVKLNGQELVLGDDFNEVGSIGDASVVFQVLTDLEIDDVVTVRIDTAGGYVTVGSGSGETNFGANVGAEAEIFKNKIGAILNFKTVKAGDSITITEEVDTITINAVLAPASVVTKVVSDTLLLTERVILADTTTGVIDLTLPPAATATNIVYDIKKIDGTGNLLTIYGDGVETIDGLLTLSTSVQFESFTLVCDGVAWFII